MTRVHRHLRRHQLRHRRGNALRQGAPRHVARVDPHRPGVLVDGAAGRRVALYGIEISGAADRVVGATERVQPQDTATTAKAGAATELAATVLED